MKIKIIEEEQLVDRLADYITSVIALQSLVLNTPVNPEPCPPASEVSRGVYFNIGQLSAVFHPDSLYRWPNWPLKT